MEIFHPQNERNVDALSHGQVSPEGQLLARGHGSTQILHAAIATS